MRAATCDRCPLVGAKLRWHLTPPPPRSVLGRLHAHGDTEVLIYCCTARAWASSQIGFGQVSGEVRGRMRRPEAEGRPGGITLRIRGLKEGARCALLVRDSLVASRCRGTSTAAHSPDAAPCVALVVLSAAAHGARAGVRSMFVRLSFDVLANGIKARISGGEVGVSVFLFATRSAKTSTWP